MKIRFASLLLCSVMLFLTACGASDEPAAPIIIATPEPTAVPVAGGRLALPMPANAEINDPLGVDTEEMLGFYGLIYECLIDVDENNVLVSHLAETWTCDDTGKVWTITLRKNVVWHGVESVLSAADVEYTWNKIVALGDDTYYSYVTKRVEDIDANGDGTLTVTMKHRGLMSLYALNFPILPRVSGSAETPIGTGPYYVSYVGDDNVLLSVNERWWRTAPYIESIGFYERDSNATAIASYEAGQLNMLLTSAVSAGRLREEGVTKVVDADTHTAELLLFNYGSGMFNNLDIRRAIYYAIDRSSIITDVYMNHATAVDVPLPPFSWLYDSASKVYDYNLESARSLLESAGWVDRDGDGLVENRSGGELSITLLVNETLDNALRREAAERVSADLLQLGITVTINALPHALGQTDSEYIEALVAGDYDIAMAGFSLSRDGDLTELLSAAGSRNYTGYSSEIIETLLNDMLVAADEAALRTAAGTFQRQYIETLPMLVLYFRQESIVFASEIQGIGDIMSPSIFRTAARWYMNTDAE